MGRASLGFAFRTIKRVALGWQGRPLTRRPRRFVGAIVDRAAALSERGYNPPALSFALTKSAAARAAPPMPLSNCCTSVFRAAVETS